MYDLTQHLESFLKNHSWIEEMGVCQRQGVEEMKEDDQRVKTSSYKINKFWEIIYRMAAVVNHTASCIFESVLFFF